MRLRPHLGFSRLEVILVLLATMLFMHQAFGQGSEHVSGHLYPDRISLWMAVSRGGLILEEDLGKRDLGKALQSIGYSYLENVDSLTVDLCNEIDPKRQDFDHIGLGHRVNTIHAVAGDLLASSLNAFILENENNRAIIEESITLGRSQSAESLQDFASVYAFMGLKDTAKMFGGVCKRLKSKENESGTGGA